MTRRWQAVIVRRQARAETDEFVCLYTVGNSDAGALGVSVGSVSADLAANPYDAVYVHSGTVAMDNVAPTATTDTKYYSNSNLSAGSELVSGSYRKQGETVYTKLVFSEEVAHTKSDSSSARPEVFYRIGSTDTQYDILNNADTLAHGDCKPTSGSATDEYICMYTTPASTDGTFTVKVGTDTTDIATNAFASAYTNTNTITLDTTAPTYSSATVSYTGSKVVGSNTYLNSGDTVAVALTFSEAMDAVQPTVQFKNGTSNLGSLVTATGSGATRTATYTVASSDTVTVGNLKYDVTNETALDDAAGNSLSGTIAEATISSAVIDNTRPTVTSGSTGYYGTYTSGSFSNEISKPVKGGVNIYTQVSFSEDMAEVIADDGTARPKISYDIAGTTTQYDIVADTATLGDGDCQATSASATSEWVCRYTVTNSNAGAFKVKVATDATDLAGNALASAYTHAGDGVTLDNVAPTVTSGSVGYYGLYTDSTYTFSNEITSGRFTTGKDIYTKVVFSEQMTQTPGTGASRRPVLKYSIAGTESDYEIVATGTSAIASGKCKPSSATETDEYVCRYTVGSSDNGAFTVIAATTTTDLATNEITTEYTHGTTLALDTTAPAAPTNLDLLAASDSAGVTGTDSDNYTNISSGLTITGCAEDGSTVQLYNNNAIISGATDVADGASGCTAPAKQFSINTVSLSANATHSITAKATDVATNTGSASSALSITVDTAAPSVSSGTLDLAAADDTGLYDNDNVTKSTSGLTVSGTLSGDPGTGDYVQLYNGSTLIASANDSSFTGTPARSWSIDLSLANNATPYAITARVLDKAGNAGSVSTTLSIRVDTASTSNVSSQPVLASDDDHGSSSSDAITNATSGLTFTGSIIGSVDGDYVQLYDGGTEISGAVSDAFAAGSTGAWTIDASLAEGAHTIAARVFDIAGNQSTGALSSALNVTIDTTVPTNSPGAFSFEGQGTDKGSLKEKAAVVIVGATDATAVAANEYVRVYNDTTLLGTDTFAAADADGAVAWRLDLGVRAIPRGSHTLTAKYFDVAGNASATTTTYPVTIKSSGGGGRAGGASVKAPIFGFLGGSSAEEKEVGDQSGQPGGQPVGGQQQQQQQQSLPNRSYSIGDTGPFVLQVQQKLNETTDCQVAESGAGSSGNETQYYGSRTAQAVRCYKIEYLGFADTPATTGVLDTQTAAALFGVSVGQWQGGQQQPGNQQTQSTEEEENKKKLLTVLRERLKSLQKKLQDLLDRKQAEQTRGGNNESKKTERKKNEDNTPIYTFNNANTTTIQGITETYTIGDRNAVIQQAKQILNTTLCKIAPTGTDSPGNETDELTRFTMYALRCYQYHNNLTATGNLTPETYTALLNEPGASTVPKTNPTTSRYTPSAATSLAAT